MENKENLKEYLLKEVEIIQGIIRRMATNSFIIKGWTLTLVVGTLLLRGSKYQVFIALIPLITFWFLDAYFLRMERLYRKLYNWVIKNRLLTMEDLLSMDVSRFENKVDSLIRTMLWKPKNKKVPTLLLFYGSILVVVIIYFLILLYYN